jgi:alpha-tubulin suppressor-like RCC1 family protein
MRKLILHLLAVSQILHCVDVGAAPGGQVIGWGNNLTGQATGVPFFGFTNVPVGITNSTVTVGPVLIAASPLNDAVQISAGIAHGLALKADGTVVGWGGNSRGEAIGVKTEYPYRTNGLVVIGGRVLSNVVAISAAGRHSLALKRDGSVIAWGAEGEGEPIPMPGGLVNITAVAAAWDYNLALKRDGSVVEWPESKVPQGLSNVTAIATGNGGYAPCLVLKKDGSLTEWGPGGFAKSVPEGLATVLAISVGGGHCLALKKDGTVMGWGGNHEGQATGIPNTNAPFISEGLVRMKGEILTNVTAIAAGGQYSLALKKDGKVVAWGFDPWRTTDVPAGLSNVVAIAAGSGFCLAISTNIDSRNVALPVEKEK